MIRENDWRALSLLVWIDRLRRGTSTEEMFVVEIHRKDHHHFHPDENLLVAHSNHSLR